MVLFSLAVYIAFQLGVGAWVSRRIYTEDDYLLAGRRLGPVLGTFSIFATWFGAETCIGSAGAIYDGGLAAGHADPFGYGLCLLLMGLILARPLYRRGLTTLADLYRQRYGPTAERWAVVLMIPASILWAAAQVRAFGDVLAHASGLDPLVGVTVAAAVVIVYTAWGGMLADAYTDLIQGVALLVGLIVLFVLVWTSGGGEALARVPVERWNPMQGFDGLDGVEKWLVPICGSVVAVELVSRVISCRSEAVAVRSTLSASALYFAAGMIPALLGLMGAVLHPGLLNGETLLPMLADTYLPPALGLVFTGALVSAILSTVDSTLLVSGALVSHNILIPLWPRPLSEAQKVRLARLSVAVLGVVAYGLALGSEGVYALVEEASAFGSSGLFVAVVMGLLTQRGGAYAALGAMGTGFVVYLVGDKILAWPQPYTLSLVAAFAAFFVGAWFDERSAAMAQPAIAEA